MQGHRRRDREGSRTPRGTRPLKRILAVAGDPGAGDVVAPLAAELRARGHEVEAVALGPARFAFERAGFVPVSAPAPGRRADLVVAGTGFPESAELPLLETARAEGIRRVLVLDSARDPRRLAPYLPLADFVLTVSQAHRESLARAGFPSDRTASPGHLAYEGIRARRAELAARIGDVRRRWTPEGERLVVFLSENIRGAFGKDVEREIGFDERRCLRETAEALFPISDPPLRLVVKLHPKEARFDLAERIGRDPAVRFAAALADEVDPAALLASADLVVGMFTVALVWASLLETVTLSYQPDRISPPPLVTAEAGVTPIVARKEELPYALERLLFDEPAREAARARARAWGDGVATGAAARAADLIEAGF